MRIRFWLAFKGTNKQYVLMFESAPLPNMKHPGGPAGLLDMLISDTPEETRMEPENDWVVAILRLHVTPRCMLVVASSSKASS